MTFRENLAFTRSCFAEAALASVVELQTTASRIVSARRARLATLVAAPVVPLLFVGGAAAVTCGNAGTNQLTSLISSASMVLVVLGGALSLACFAAAAIMFMTSSGSSGRADKAMKWVKNTLIGLAILGGGLFLRTILLNIVDGTGKSISGGKDAGTTELTKCAGSSGDPVGP